MNQKFDYLIVGAGLFGSTFAHLATQSGKRCIVIDQRDHIGGNLYCEDVEGINVHKYGAHIFHTSDKKVWKFVNGLTPFNRYTNSPVALAPDGKLYNLPFNMNTFFQLWGTKTPQEAMQKLEAQRRDAIERMKENGVNTPRNLEEQALCMIGKDIYELLIRNYTEKQWGRPCSQLPSFIIRRLPIRLTFDNNYFNDSYQGIPEGGYNRIIAKLLIGSTVHLGRRFDDALKSNWPKIANKLVYSGAIDEYFNYSLGRLDWRTVNFDTEIKNTSNFQGNAVVNFTDAFHPFTRIIEHKHFEKFGDSVYENPLTVISKEYSVEYKPGMEPYYPVNDSRNECLAQQYREMANREENVIFGGRLAEYKYYDMDLVIERAFEAWKNNCL